MCSVQRLKSVIQLKLKKFGSHYDSQPFICIHVLHIYMYYINTVKFSLASKQSSLFSKFSSRKVLKTRSDPDFHEIAGITVK